MVNRKSTASLLVFLGAVLCFFLPFVTISCGGMESINLSGRQLATGTSLKEENPFGPPSAEKVDANPMASLALLSAIAGLGLSCVGRRMSGAASVCGGAGVLLLLILRGVLSAQIEEKTHGLAAVHYQPGYIFALLLLAAGAVWNAVLFLRSRNRRIPGQAIWEAAKQEFRGAASSQQIPPQ